MNFSELNKKLEKLKWVAYLNTIKKEIKKIKEFKILKTGTGENLDEVWLLIEYKYNNEKSDRDGENFELYIYPSTSGNSLYCGYKRSRNGVGYIKSTSTIKRNIDTCIKKLEL